MPAQPSTGGEGARARERPRVPLAAHPRKTVDRDLGGIRQEPHRPVLANWKAKELGGLVDEPRRAVAGEEIWVFEQIEQEGNVRFHAAYAEFLECPFHAPAGVDEPPARGADLHEERVVERRDDSAGDRWAAIGPDPHSPYRPVMSDPTVVGREPVFGVLGRHAALKRVALDLYRSLRGQVDLRV